MMILNLNLNHCMWEEKRCCHTLHRVLDLIRHCHGLHGWGSVSIIGLIIMATLFVHELRFYLQTVTVHEVIILTTSLFP